MEEETKMQSSTPLGANSNVCASNVDQQDRYVTGNLAASQNDPSADGTSPTVFGEIWFRKLGADEGLPKPNRSSPACSTADNTSSIDSASEVKGGTCTAAPAPAKLDLQVQGQEDKDAKPAQEKGGQSATGSRSVTGTVAGSTSTSSNKKKRKRLLTEDKRLERNSREQERSNQVSHQFAELREILSQSGIVIPKGTKSSVLGIAHQYIRALQDQEKAAAAANQALVGQVGALVSGQSGEMAQRAVRHAGTVNGIWDLPYFQGQHQLSCPTASTISNPHLIPSLSPSSSYTPSTTTGEVEYYSLFDQSPVPMALASLGGTLLDCNRSFRLLTGVAKEDLSSLTLFNLVAQEDLKVAFEGISTMLAKKEVAPTSTTSTAPPIVVKAYFDNRLPGMDLKVTMIRKRSNGEAQSLCVALANHHDQEPTNNEANRLAFFPTNTNTSSGVSGLVSPNEELLRGPLNYSPGPDKEMEGGFDEPTPFQAIG